MKILLLTTAFVFTASAIPQNEWTTYKAEYNKVYTSEWENMRRLEQYLKTKEMVEEHNRKYDRGETTYTMGMNKFADWFPEELQVLTPVMPQRARDGGKPFELPPGTPVPDSINWVDKGAVTSVKDQGDECAPGYAFSAAGALEALMYIKNETVIDLSEQELIDCSPEGGCEAVDVQASFDYVHTRNGIDSYESYPYEGVNGSCRANKGNIAATCSGYKRVANEDELRAVVGTVAPVSIVFGVTLPFVFYKGGIYDGACTLGGNHAMLVVGYDTDKATETPYWLIKNSWGTKWGEKGYVRVIRNKDKCRVGDLGSYPI